MTCLIVRTLPYLSAGCRSDWPTDRRDSSFAIEGRGSYSRHHSGARVGLRGQVWSAETKSSRREIPISKPVRNVRAAQHSRSVDAGTEDLVFATRNQTPLNPKNFQRRLLRSACQNLGLPLVSWHSSRHRHATQLSEVGESLHTAQALLGHSALETTLNVYTHDIPDAQRRAEDKVAEILFPNVHKIGSATENEKVSLLIWQALKKWSRGSDLNR